ncbi:MAG: response regulator transcription factor [Armatimonadetes bacterium]|nr:response regulator transcription factor [Armatimonadota bacterium]
MRVLVAEDEQRILSFVQRALEEQGFDVVPVRDGDEALSLAQVEHFDVLVLDIMLPGRDGLSIVRRLREQRCATPILVITARSALEERLEGLNLGADDYLTKPFYVEELIARIHAVLRRSSADRSSVLQAGELSVNLLTRDVRVAEREVELTGREFDLLGYLLRSAGRVVPRTQLLEHIWGYDFDPGSNVVDVCIQRLRRKLDPYGELIETVRGVGYRLRG